VHAFGRVYYEKNITSNTETLYIYGLTGRIAKKCGEELMYYHTDRLGTTHILTDSSGFPITAVEYEPFGDADLSGENERYLYTGQEIDTSGLYYYRARYYDVETGRFLSRDRWVGDYRRPQTLNKYVYCVNNPLKYSDPTGNSFSYADDIITSITIEPDLENSETPDPTEFAKMLSEIVTLKIIANFDPDPYNTSRNAMEEAMQIFEDPEDQKKFEEAWKDTFSKTCLEFASPTAAEERLDKALLELEGDLTCLMEHTSEELWGVAKGLMGSPVEQMEMLRKVAYIANEYYNIAIKDEYKGPPPNLDELCGKDEPEGMCTGSILLSIFLMFSLFLIPFKKEDMT
jgi:RHS repeat-associated protein